MSLEKTTYKRRPTAWSLFLSILYPSRFPIEIIAFSPVFFEQTWAYCAHCLALGRVCLLLLRCKNTISFCAPWSSRIYSMHSLKKKKTKRTKIKVEAGTRFFQNISIMNTIIFSLIDTALLTTASLNFTGKSLFSCTKASFSHKLFSATARNALHKYCTILNGVT